MNGLFEAHVDDFAQGSLAPAVMAAVDAVRPPPERHAGGWAEAHRVLPKGSAEPGPWRTSRVPYTVPIYEATEDPRYRRIVVVMGSQMSKTELLLNVIGKRFHDGPYYPTLYVGPTQKAVHSMSRDRVQSMLESTPALYARLKKGQDDKVFEKWIGGIRLGFAWAGSPTELASHPAGLVVVDERDRMGSDVGEEGDPVGLAAARLDTYAQGKLLVCSTPTIEGASPIWALFESGTMGKWAWPCVHCGEYFVPCLALFRYPKSRDMTEVRAGARVVCPHCGAELEEADRFAMNQAGRYVHHRRDDNGEHVPVDAVADTSVASFWVSGLASPWKRWGELAEQLAAAYAMADQETLQTLVNTAAGEVFKVRGHAPEWERVHERRRPVPRASVPNWVQLVTMGCDVQKMGIYWVIRGWGFGARSHLIDHGYVHGDTSLDSVWMLWRQIVNRPFGKRFLVDVCFVDSGYNPKRDQNKRPEHQVYTWCRRTGGRAYPTKGHDRSDDKPIRASMIDITIDGRTVKHGVTLFHVNTDYFKTSLHAEINVPPELGEDVLEHWTLHQETDVDYCRQVVAEELIVKPSGHRIWICPGRRDNHFLDCEVLAAAAARARQVDTLPAEPPPPASEVPATDHGAEFIDDFGDEFWGRH